MTQKTLKCIRCHGKGNVRKYIMYGCSEYFLELWDVLVESTLYFPLYLLASFIIGGILGFFHFILLKNTLSFNIFGVIFYFFGGISMPFVICIIFFDYKFLFKNRINSLIILILLIFCGHLNIKFGRYLIIKKGIFKTFLNLIYAFIQGGSIGFSLTYLILRRNKLDEINGKTKCPLCEGNKSISPTLFNKLKRCQICSMNCGYKNPVGIGLFEKRHFCINCNGIGYIK